MGGDDTLSGGLGRDTLSGGTGRDVFVFDTKPNAKTNLDRIAGYSVADDTIWLENAVFKALGKKTGALKSSAFHAGEKAHDASDRIVYNPKTGALFYDEDGTGAKAAIEMALLDKLLP